MIKTCNVHVNGKSLNPPIHALIYDDFFNRLKGLMVRHEISHDEGIILAQKNDSKLDASIHMLGVFMDLGIVWVNSQMVVVDLIIAKSWKPIYIPAQPAKFILEINPIRIHEFQLNDTVLFDEII